MTSISCTGAFLVAKAVVAQIVAMYMAELANEKR